MNKSASCGVAALLCLLASGDALAQKSRSKGRAQGPIGNIGALFSPDNYPPAALRAGQEGRVIAELAIDATGLVTDCKIKTSVSPSLDAATCRAVQTGQPVFKPARDERGKPVASTYILPVNWQLPGAPPIQPNATRFDVVVETDGSVSRCEAVVLPSGTIPPADEARVCQAMARGMAQGVAQRNGGVPVRFRILMTKDTSFGDAPLLSGAWPQEMQKVQFWQSDFDLDAEGYATNCTINQQVGFVDVQNVMTPCRERRRYQPGPAPMPQGHDSQRMGYQLLPPVK